MARQQISSAARRSGHRVVLGLALATLAAAAVLRVDEQGAVVVPLVNLQLPAMCWFRRTTGLDCPGCGLTRSVVCFVHGDSARAWQFNPVGILVVVAAVYSIPYRLWQLRRMSLGLRELWHPPLGWAVVAFFLLLVLQWVQRLPFH